MRLIFSAKQNVDIDLRANDKHPTSRRSLYMTVKIWTDNENDFAHTMEIECVADAHCFRGSTVEDVLGRVQVVLECERDQVAAIELQDKIIVSQGNVITFDVNETQQASCSFLVSRNAVHFNSSRELTCFKTWDAETEKYGELCKATNIHSMIPKGRSFVMFDYTPETFASILVVIAKLNQTISRCAEALWRSSRQPELLKLFTRIDEMKTVVDFQAFNAALDAAVSRGESNALKE